MRMKGHEPYLVTRQDLKETLEYISGYSLYAYEDEIRQGYISVQGRTQSWCHRQGDSEWRSYQRDEVYFLYQCPPVASAPGLCRCSDAIYQRQNHIAHTLIISPPREARPRFSVM